MCYTLDMMIIKRQATIADIQISGTKRQKTVLFGYNNRSNPVPKSPLTLFRVQGNNRNKYYLVECMFCNRQYVVRSDHLKQKKCKCS